MTIVSAFRSSLDRQLLAILVVAAVLAVAWNVIRTVHYRRAAASGATTAMAVDPWPYREPLARRVLRISFGLLWLLDGLLQIQSGMPLGLPGQVLTPAAASSPGWVQHLVNAGATVWSDHPVTAAAATGAAGCWDPPAPRSSTSRPAS